MPGRTGVLLHEDGRYYKAIVTEDETNPFYIGPHLQVTLGAPVLNWRAALGVNFLIRRSLSKFPKGCGYYCRWLLCV